MLAVRPHYMLVPPVAPGDRKQSYHGVDRPEPAHLVDLTEGSATYAIWRDEFDATDQEYEWCRFFDRLDVARDFRRRYAEHGYEFEIIAVYPCNDPLDARAIERLPGYLGLDVSSMEPDSALHPARMWESFPPGSGAEHLVPIWRLEQAYFQPRLNQWGLLTDYTDAVLLHDLKHALQVIDQRYGEPAGVRVLAIVRVGEEA
jgi:hypothetical protein